MDSAISAGERPAQFHFSGTTGEYFRIWIVNIALTIVTLGIYSAWATVRKKRYFYSNTSFADGRFDYHANPKTILIGRIIAVSMLGIYFLSSYLHQLAPGMILLLIFLMVPYFVVRSRRFQNRVTSYRNIRFDFTGTMGDAFSTYYKAAAITVISLGLATPTANHMRAEYGVANSAFGRTNFNFAAERDSFYQYFWRSVGLTFLVVIGYFLLQLFMTPMMATDAQTPEVSTGLLLLIYTQLLILAAGYAAVGVYYQVRIRNHLVSTTSLGGNSFESNLSVRTMLGLYLTNLVAIVFTLGLATPWAQVRLARYRAECTRAILTDDWDSYVAAATDSGTALGDEIGEAFDVDVGLGF